jgi:glutathione peroxidase
MDTPIIYDIPVAALDGTPTTLAPYRGKVLLVVNVASKCGFTPQYAGLEALYQKYKDRGLVVLGFPCNQFLGQEPGDAAQIGQFCTVNYGVTFPVFAKLNVNGPEAHPLYRHLKAARRGVLFTKAIKWNFTKFLVGRDGRVAGRFGAFTKPEALAGRIEDLLAQPEGV